MKQKTKTQLIATLILSVFLNLTLFAQPNTIHKDGQKITISKYDVPLQMIINAKATQVLNNQYIVDSLTLSNNEMILLTEVSRTGGRITSILQYLRMDGSFTTVFRTTMNYYTPVYDEVSNFYKNTKNYNADSVQVESSDGYTRGFKNKAETFSRDILRPILIEDTIPIFPNSPISGDFQYGKIVSFRDNQFEIVKETNSSYFTRTDIEYFKDSDRYVDAKEHTSSKGDKALLLLKKEDDVYGNRLSYTVRISNCEFSVYMVVNNYQSISDQIQNLIEFSEYIIYKKVSDEARSKTEEPTKVFE